MNFNQNLFYLQIFIKIDYNGYCLEYYFDQSDGYYENTVKDQSDGYYVNIV